MATGLSIPPRPRADEPGHFSTDPVTSKQLRDRMRAEGWEYMIWSWEYMIWSRRHTNTYRCRFAKNGEEIESVSPATAATEELAVAIAALRAKGMK